MQLEISYKRILAISTPIMLGSAVQNVVALSDSVFLYHLSEGDFAAIGFVGVFYMIIAAIGYGFSKGGQIMIARRMGELEYSEVGRTFYMMVYFELFLSLFMFAFMKFGCQYFFSLFVDSPIIYTKSLEYLDYRAYGVFFAYAGVAIIALYTGVARTFFIIIDTLILATVNIVLNYGLIFGKWGLPEMGIAGAGLASTIAEISAFIIFVLYIFWDKKSQKYNLFSLPKLDIELIKKQQKLAFPVVAQAVVGIGSWFVFFSFVEDLGERELAITNLIRMVYLVLSIPCWGFSSGINTLVSNMIGQAKRYKVMTVILKTSKMSLVTTLLISLPVVIFPQQLLYPLLGSSDLSLIQDAQPIFFILLIILLVFSVGAIFFNGLAGTGATFYGLKLQTGCAVGYLIYIYTVINYTNGGLPWAWAAEAFYWIAILLFSFYFIKSKKWYKLKV